MKKEELFQQIIKEHKDKLFRLVYAYLYDKSAAEDLMQEVWINVWESLSKYKGDAQLSTWLYRITVNTTISFNRSSTRKKDLNETYKKEAFTDDYDFEKDEQINMLMKAIHQLKEDERLVIGLVLEDLSYKEISEVLGISVNNIGVKINRIKNKLSKILNHERA
ncbi:RNA polymerase sigma factor [Sediminitomix flava]|uniref:RNA polymerase sigma-70 factor (ECF subfamily) n=1 Tax=Sediminitomix flava TaxID=379075 RepID=A0A315Z7E5_SEDFL|nr:RNA polymerase sigma factor [Sediminitomix flava]PWJ40882.1 RNA polymerase sigma-70 factor (ECF subfamily) [Sediminitomix flava]